MTTSIKGSDTFITAEAASLPSFQVLTPWGKTWSLPRGYTFSHTLRFPTRNRPLSLLKFARSWICTTPRIRICYPEPGDVINKAVCTGICRNVGLHSQPCCAEMLTFFENQDLPFSKGSLPDYTNHNHIAEHEGIGHVVASYDPSILGLVVAAQYGAATCETCWANLRNLPDAC